MRHNFGRTRVLGEEQRSIPGNMECKGELECKTRCKTRKQPCLEGVLTADFTGEVGSGGRIRTYDQRINSPLRYRCATPEYAIPFGELA